MAQVLAILSPALPAGGGTIGDGGAGSGWGGPQQPQQQPFAGCPPLRPPPQP